ncbi:MAG: signal recognition particle-docking protein FtsY, partial [Bacilli bacterium]
KMDGTSKGGIILSIRDELNIPVRFIGFGETLNDLLPFDLNKYIYALCVSPDSEEE